MATVFDSHFAAAGFPMLLDNFGESIAYIPASGQRRVISAIVERNPPAIFDAAGNAVMPTATIRVYNSNTSGIASKSVDIGSDQIEFRMDIGDMKPKTFSLMTMMSQDSGVTQLAII
jgi:hypothetical protein